MATLQQPCRLMMEATDDLVAWAEKIHTESNSQFEAAQQLVRRLGVHCNEAGLVEIGFWVPELIEKEIPVSRVFLEILTPLDPIDFEAAQQTISFHQERIHLVRNRAFYWGVVAGMQPGSRDQVGAFYRLVYQDSADHWHSILDPLANSLPFGAFAPAEYYDVHKLQQQRNDQAYFESLTMTPDPDGIPRIDPPLNILQLHINTASAEGTLAGLTRIYQTISEKQRQNEPLTTAEQNYVGYDAVQLMPIEPIIEYEAGPSFWQQITDEKDADIVQVSLSRPDMTNWGYDVVISGSSAINPAVLGSKRPDELIDFISTLHNLHPKPIKVIFDIVYGHADNQALPLLNRHFFAGANMYGQNMNYRSAVVRAILLEMQRRKSDFGVDGIRVDGAQDFKYWDAEAQLLHHDDDYLRLMNDIVQNVAGVRYRPWMIFEDGRPWPRDDWELSSTYLEVTKQFPNVVQWGPLTFAHNTPFLFTFWISKWWRIQEIMTVGKSWITGCANHDTVRRGTQVDPEARINTYLGQDLVGILRNAYDNPANNLFTYGFMPGIPMDFINASMRAPWSFIRNTDDRYAVKVVSEESRFLKWQVDPANFNQSHNFLRLKELGFTDLDELRRFLHILDHTVQLTNYNMDAIVQVLQANELKLEGPPSTVSNLKRFARAWMDDLHDYCNVAQYVDQLDEEQTRFNLKLRQFRRIRPWLMDNLQSSDYFSYIEPCDGTVLFYGLRQAPNGREQLLFVANMEGAPNTFTSANLPIPNLPLDGWQLAISTPKISPSGIEQPLTLSNSEGVIWVRSNPL